LAADDLNYLIKHQRITVISFGEASKYLDKDFGYQTFRKNPFINYESLLKEANYNLS